MSSDSDSPLGDSDLDSDLTVRDSNLPVGDLTTTLLFMAFLDNKYFGLRQREPR